MRNMSAVQRPMPRTEESWAATSSSLWRASARGDSSTAPASTFYARGVCSCCRHRGARHSTLSVIATARCEPESRREVPARPRLGFAGMSARDQDPVLTRAGPGSHESGVSLPLGGRPVGRLSRSGWIALAIGLAVTAALALTSLAVYNRNERRLLHLRVRELSLVLADTLPSIQLPLASAGELAIATNGNAQKFRAFMTPYVGHGRQFASASLWRLEAPRPRLAALVGMAQVAGSQPRTAAELFARAQHAGVLNVIGLLGSPRPGLGFEFTVTAPSRTRRFAVYAENPLPANRRSAIARSSALRDST